MHSNSYTYCNIFSFFGSVRFDVEPLKPTTNKMHPFFGKVEERKQHIGTWHLLQHTVVLLHSPYFNVQHQRISNIHQAEMKEPE